MGKSWYIVAWPESEAEDPETKIRAMLAKRTVDDRMGLTSAPRQRGEPDCYGSLSYAGVGDLVGKVNQMVKKPDWLQVLEIIAHGSPSGCGEINAATIDAAGKQLKTLDSSGETWSIYLAGCNTGTLDPAAKGSTQPRSSLARKLADAMPFVTKPPTNPDFWEHHLTVYGTNGYGDSYASSMTNLGNNMITKRSAKKDTVDYPQMDLPPGYNPPTYPATGKDCWIPNKNDSVEKW